MKRPERYLTFANREEWRAWLDEPAFTSMPPSRRKGYLAWLSSAKRPETRQKRIQAIVKLAAAGT